VVVKQGLPAHGTLQPHQAGRIEKLGKPNLLRRVHV